MSLKFGTSGLRGLSTDLLGTASSRYTLAFCQHLVFKGLAKLGDPILVGQDFRESSPAIARQCLATIKQAGFEPIDCGVLPTPALAYYGQKRNAASLMVTGSHIPADRNGIKFYTPLGEITKADEVGISSFAEKVPQSVEADLVFTKNEHADAVEQFMARCKAILPDKALEGMTVGVYQHSSVARDMLVDLLSDLGAQAVPLARSECFIPIDTEAVSPESLDLLKNWAAESRFDAFISTDGDADRPMVADENGVPLRGDLLGLITAKFLDADYVVTPVTSNSGIERNLAIDVKRTKVGSPYVIEGMEQGVSLGNKRVVGFEANGGFLTASSFVPTNTEISALPTRDCFLPMLAALYLCRQKALPMSTIVKQFNMPVAVGDRLQNFEQDRSASLMSYLRASSDNVAAFVAPLGLIKEVSDIDGIRVFLKDGRMVHFRPSGNAPEMRCYAEAETPELADTLLKRGLSRIASYKQS